MKNHVIMLIVSISIILSGCFSTTQIGSVNMIANRNIETKGEYYLLSSYAGSSKKELKRNKAKTIEQSIDNVVKSVAGGEYLMNVKIFKVSLLGIPRFSQYSIYGDIWGIKTTEVNFKGFKEGDSVQWKKHLVIHTGVIVELKDNESCIVKENITNKNVQLKYVELLKIK